MTTDPILTMSQWLSPGFPVGAFAYSHGLESAVADGLIPDADALTAWLCDVLEHGTGRCDAILLRVGYDDPKAADAHARAFAASAERLQELDLQGRAFCETLRATEGLEMDGLAYPVAVGFAASQKGVPVDIGTALYLQAMLANLVSAAQRLMPMGQTDGQRVLNALRPLVAEVTAATDGAGLDDLHSSAWMSDIAAMRHETLQPRIFRT